MEGISSKDALRLDIAHKGTHYNLSLLPTSTLESLQLQLEELTSVPPHLQKLLYKGKKSVNYEEAKDISLESVGLKDGMKVTMLGSTERELGTMQKVTEEKRRKEEIIAQRKGGTVRFFSINYAVFNLQQGRYIFV